MIDYVDKKHNVIKADVGFLPLADVWQSLLCYNRVLTLVAFNELTSNVEHLKNHVNTIGKHCDKDKELKNAQI